MFTVIKVQNGAKRRVFLPAIKRVVDNGVAVLAQEWDVDAREGAAACKDKNIVLSFPRSCRPERVLAYDMFT
jgi:hypothetical protein